MNNKELELEAEKYRKNFIEGNININDIFIAGATSNAAKEYWYEQFEKQKLEFAIEHFKKHIEHPTKPGYKRNDILDKIKKLEQQLNNLIKI